MPPTATIPSSVGNLRVTALKPLSEAGKNYAIDDEFSVPAERAARLHELGLIRIVDPNAPPPGPKLQAAREAAGKLSDEATARSREWAAIQEEVKGAEAKVSALRLALSAAAGLEDVRRAQDALAEAERDAAAKGQLLANVAQRARESGTRAEAARKTLVDLERRAQWLRAEGIPGQEANLADHRRDYQLKVRDAESCLAARVRPAEVQLQKFQEELKALEG